MTTYAMVALVLYIAREGFGYWLEYLNIRHMKLSIAVLPEEFNNVVGKETIDKIQSYEIDKATFGVVSSLFGNVILIAFIFGGILNIYNNWISSLNLPFIAAGLVFFLALSYAETLLSMPFSLYRTFEIEKIYGFNTMTLKLWLLDSVKSLLLSTILMGILISGALWLIEWSPAWWWLWVWAAFLAFSVFMMYVSPYVIEPLFNKFTPIEDEGLETAVRLLMDKVDIKVSRVFKMDASRRSTHTNAYFSGLGKVKRIVLYDTLLKSMDTDEVLAVLAHEAGHWKKHHVLKLMALYEVIAFAGLYVFYRVVSMDYVATVFAIGQGTLFAKAILISFIASIVFFPLSPLLSYAHRRHEREADRFASEATGDSKPMIMALVKLAKDNLSNLYPHPLYVSFYYSHPPILERIKYIGDIGNAGNDGNDEIDGST
ncbi:MAG: M48 family metallopeptidase [Nitrospirae bacterium]|nr:M48 family metallopeptidase [Nitrospirota bacterium]